MNAVSAAGLTSAGSRKKTHSDRVGGLTDCGNTIGGGGAPATDGCNMLCNGNQTEICGGPGRLNVYDYLMQYPVSTSTKSSSTVATTSAIS